MIDSIITELDEDGEWVIADTGEDDDVLMDRIIESMDQQSQDIDTSSED